MKPRTSPSTGGTPVDYRACLEVLEPRVLMTGLSYGSATFFVGTVSMVNGVVHIDAPTETVQILPVLAGDHMTSADQVSPYLHFQAMPANDRNDGLGGGTGEIPVADIKSIVVDGGGAHVYVAICEGDWDFNKKPIKISMIGDG